MVPLWQAVSALSNHDGQPPPLTEISAQLGAGRLALLLAIGLAQLRRITQQHSESPIVGDGQASEVPLAVLGPAEPAVLDRDVRGHGCRKGFAGTKIAVVAYSAHGVEKPGCPRPGGAAVG